MNIIPHGRLVLLIGYGVICVSMVGGCAPDSLPQSTSEQQGVSRQEAKRIAQNVQSVKAMLGLYRQGGFQACIEEEVMRPCDSDWVSCVDNAWVVRIATREACFPGHDERLGVTLLIDALSGDVKSVFPEESYFINPQHCREAFDCILQEGNSCKNFIYGQMASPAFKEESACACQDQACVLRK